jgi:hypothetical protein
MVANAPASRNSALRRLGRRELTCAPRSDADRQSSSPSIRSDDQRQTDRASHPIPACEVEPFAALPTAAAVNHNRVTNVSLAGVAPADGGPISKRPRDDQLEIGTSAYDEPPFGEEPGRWIMRTRRGGLKRPAHPWTRGQSDHAESDGHPPSRRLIANRLTTRQDANRGVTSPSLAPLAACTGGDGQSRGDRQSHYRPLHRLHPSLDYPVPGCARRSFVAVRVQ